MARGDGSGGSGPILVHGHGRTGTTLFVELMALHPSLGWLSQYVNARPRWPQLAALSRVRDVPVASRALNGRRPYPMPQEAIRVWERCFPGFYMNEGEWTAQDAPADAVAEMRSIVATTLRWQGKERFLTKYTGFPRAGFMRAVLPGSSLVHVVRDPRPVVMSVVKQRWGFKQKPEQWAAMSSTERIDRAVERYLRWWDVVSGLDDVADVEVRFEDLVADVRGEIGRVCDAVGLDLDDRFAWRLDQVEMHDPGDGWAAALSDADRAHLEERLAAPVASYLGR